MNAATARGMAPLLVMSKEVEQYVTAKVARKAQAGYNQACIYMKYDSKFFYVRCKWWRPRVRVSKQAFFVYLRQAGYKYDWFAVNWEESEGRLLIEW